MKRILITGANSYIGMSFEKYMKKNYPDDYIVDTVDMIDGTWRGKSFADYDSVFHVAGIAHQKETRENASLYYKVNRDLAVETAEKAKRDGVKQFIFLSSMSVYGMNTGVITKETVPNPKSNYGKSKYQAEQLLNKVRGGDFVITIIRPPMLYGPGCKGNYQTIATIINRLPIFPNVKNKRSLIYVDNLSEFIHLALEKHIDGVFIPQNSECVSTVDMARAIAKSKGKKIHFSVALGWIVTMLRPFIPMLQKAFGNLIYADVERCKFDYCVVNNVESFERSAEGSLDE